MKALIPAYSLDDAAKRLTEMGFKLDVTDLLGMAAALELPIHVTLPAPFYKWKKNGELCREIPDFFPKGFSSLIAPVSTLTYLTYQKMAELQQVSWAIENHLVKPSRWDIIEYMAVPPYIDESKPYVVIERGDLYIESVFLGLVTDKLNNQGFASRNQLEADDKGTRDNQIETMIKVAIELGYDPLKIPRGGKKRLMFACIERDGVLFTEEGFKHAWKNTDRLKLENSDKYKAR